jgi:hypothetical protein
MSLLSCRRVFPGRFGCGLFVLGVVGCHDLTGNQALPAGTQDPGYYNDATGALGMRNAAVAKFGLALQAYAIHTGLLTDELANTSTLAPGAGGSAANGGEVVDALDERILPELPYGSAGKYPSDQTYRDLQTVRGQLLQAIGQLAVSNTSAQDTAILKPSANRALRGELHALYGLTEIMLADFFCSGVPLSTLDFQKDFTYKAGTTTPQIYQDAIAHLDTALALAVDSTRLLHLARVGLGRAYLNLGNFAAAADDVSSVPADYLYQMSETFFSGGICSGAPCNVINSGGIAPRGATVSDAEGENGFSYISSHDPRTADTVFASYAEGTAQAIHNVGYPKLYLGDSQAITVASGIEAKLIGAEAQLHVGNVNGWLTALNELRATTPLPGGAGPLPPDTLMDTLGVTGCDAAHICDIDGVSGGTFQVPDGYDFAYAVQIQPVSSQLAEYCWNNSWYEPCYDGIADTIEVYVRPARSSPLTPLADPGASLGGTAADSARVALTFQERAAWLYLTGHRQGDMRRQLRQYSRYWRDQSALYPTGAYTGLGARFYGSAVTAPIPQDEYLNPLFHGCFSRDP